MRGIRLGRRLGRGLAATIFSGMLLATPALATQAGNWSQRVQIIYDAKTGSVTRAALLAWDFEPSANLEFIFEPDQHSGFDPAANGGAITGQGKLVWRMRGSASYDRRTIHSTYIGALVDGRPHGQGRLERRTGEVLEGEWVAGRLHGKGVRIDADGIRTEANFTDGLAQGHGRQTTPAGAIYQGGFRDGLRHGEASMRLPGGASYTSLWRDGVEISATPPDAIADAMIGGLLRAQAGGGDAGKVELSVSVDQRITQQADMRYTLGVYDDHIEIHPEEQTMIDIWLGRAMISPDSYDAVFGFIDWENAPSYLQVAMKTTDNSRVRVDTFELQVEDSQIYRKPFLSVLEHRGCVGFRPTFSLLNNGWGPARNGRLSLQFHNSENPEQISRSFEVPVGDFDEGIDVSLLSIMEQAGVDTKAAARARFTCASMQQLPQCRQRMLDELDFGEIEPLLSGEHSIGLGYRGEFSYSWSDDRGNSYEMAEPIEGELQLAAIETEGMTAEYGAGWGDPPAALRYQEVRLPADDQDYTIGLMLRGSRNVSDLTARLKVYAEHNSIHRLRAVATFADGSMRQSMPVHYYHLVPRGTMHHPTEPDGCYLDDALFTSPPQE